MQLRNEKLIAMVKALGEDVVAEKLAAKLKHDAQQKAFHKQYNAKRNQTFKTMRELAEERGMTLDQFVATVNAKLNQ